jgi:hypothetical protein
MAYVPAIPSDAIIQALGKMASRDFSATSLIGGKLRALYNETEQPTPACLNELLRVLDEHPGHAAVSLHHSLQRNIGMPKRKSEKHKQEHSEQKHTRSAAIAPDDPAAEAPSGAGAVRSAGLESMRDGCRQPWDKVDEASDESFPASDPLAY